MDRVCLQVSLAMIVAGRLCAQPVPEISAVVEAGALGLAFGYEIAQPSDDGLATIYGSGLSDGIYQTQTSSYPIKLGGTEVLISNTNSPAGAVAAGILFVSPGQINFRVPHTGPDIRPNDLNISTAKYLFVRTAGGGVSSSYSFGQFFYAPSVFFMGYDCHTDTRFAEANKNCGLSATPRNGNPAWRGAVTDAKGSLLSSNNPAKLGQKYVAWLTGLGHFANAQPPSIVGLTFTNVPVFGYPGDTYIQAPSLDYVGASLQFPGLYQINFTLPVAIATGHPSGYPPMFPCGDYNWEISLNFTEGTGIVNQKSANLVQIPVSVKRGDVACAP